MSARPQPRIFTLTLEAKPGTDAIRALRQALKVLLRKFNLRCTGVEEINNQRGHDVD